MLATATQTFIAIPVQAAKVDHLVNKMGLYLFL